MNRRDVLASLAESGTAHGRAQVPGGKDTESRAADHEEPTWEVHRPGSPRRRFDRRARAILTAAAIAAVLANAGAAWAYWHFNGPRGAGNSAFELVVSGSSDATQTLRPGVAGNLTVTVPTRHSVPIRITSIMRGAGPVVADEAHRAAGCVNPQVEINQATFAVAWEVPKDTIGAFILPGALTMREGPAACQGATFTVPVQAQAVPA
ncbi:hypothetical protein OHA21_34585 [Actinoplanes sp. NBC_00393]|uniref:hypothetical protein n=1 Tax=Actinoplanes sp. NBC_00393 TaxID=2975953 RepID=UPI002E228D96